MEHLLHDVDMQSQATQCYFVVLGDYSVVESQGGNKMIAGTIPSELGKLRNWKYVVFSEFI